MQIYAHRGASAYAPENTIEAFQLAIDMNADGIELDVQLTRDGEVVVLHDETLQRVSDGVGYVKDHTLVELKKLNFSKPIPGYKPTQIPTLEEVLELLVPTGLLLNIELKTGVFFYPGLVEKTIDLVEKYGMEERVCYSSFNHYTIGQIKELRPEAECGVLYSDGIHQPVEYAKSLGMDALHPSVWNLQYPQLLSKAREEGLRVRPWTVNRYPDMIECVQSGVDAVITNFPNIARNVLEIESQKKEKKMVVSTRGVVDLLRPAQGLKDLKKAGFEHLLIDMSEYYWRQLSDYPEKLEAEKHPISVQDLLQELDKNGQIKSGVSALKAPRLRPESKRTDANTFLENTAIETIHLAEQVGAQQVMVAPLWAGIPEEDVWNVNKSFFIKLASICQKGDTQLLLINQPKDCGGRMIRGLCSDGLVVSQWIDELNQEVGMERFGFCLDTGVCTLCGQDVQALIRDTGHRIKSVILRDCDRHGDVSMLPFTEVSNGQSTSDWMGVIRGLREIQYAGTLCLEMGDSALAMSPLLKPAFLQLSREVASFLDWQIHMEDTLKKYSSIVLFGAGNMCRNFMKCYGETYRPLFTCDNNEKVWGTEFAGLEVKSPEALKDLPEGCGVIICNVYYREIEAQLREMGIENIGFFNDEYMPSFYTDRV